MGINFKRIKANVYAINRFNIFNSVVDYCNTSFNGTTRIIAYIRYNCCNE